MKTKTIILYDYNELSDEAKENVKQWYLDDPFRSDMLTEDFEESFLKYFFPRSNLKVQWSLNSCQGDGVNIYGTLNLNDVLNYIEKWNPDEHSICKYAFDPRELFTEKEQKRLAFYREESGRDAELPHNWRYTYCIANQVDFAEDMIDDLDGFRDVDADLIRQFEMAVVKIVDSLCDEMEDYGYKYLYEVDEEEIAEVCEANDWTFTADGKFEVA